MKPIEYIIEFIGFAVMLSGIACICIMAHMMAS